MTGTMPLLVVRPFSTQRLDLAPQALPVLEAHVLGREDDDRDLGGRGGRSRSMLATSNPSIPSIMRSQDDHRGARTRAWAIPA